MRTGIALLAAALLIGGIVWTVRRPAPPPTVQIPQDGPCLIWEGPPELLTPADGRSRHHPTVGLLPTGEVLAAWQIDKVPSQIGQRTFGWPWEPLAEEQLLSLRDTQATHPQLAVSPSLRALVWTDDITGAVRYTQLSRQDGSPERPLDLVTSTAERPGLYPDLIELPGGNAAAIWYEGNEPYPRWRYAFIPPEGKVRSATIDPREDTELGGPPTLAPAAEGMIWLSWTEQDVVRPTRTTSVMLAPLDPDGVLGPPTVVASAPLRWERPALGVDEDGRVAIGWTGYPFTGGDWSAWFLLTDPSGQPTTPPIRLDRNQGHMVDVAVIDHRAVIAWEETLRTGRDLQIQVVDTRTGLGLCAPKLPHPPDAAEQARATLALQPHADGEPRGVLLWHASTDQPRQQAIWGRRFRLPRP
jgi:hypothetical protein